MITSFKNEYFFLSNFSPSNIEYEGTIYPTIEHAFQAAKTLNLASRDKIAAIYSPGKARQLGRSVLLRKDWEFIKLLLMHQFILQKFFNPNLKKKLLDTGNNILIEGNTWNDKFWGQINVNGKWIGKNWLGVILMQVRQELK